MHTKSFQNCNALEPFCWCIVFVALFLCGSGCSCRKASTDWEKLSPAIQVTIQEPSGKERVFGQALAVPALRNGVKVANASYGFTTLEKRSLLMTLGYEPDLKHAAHILMEMSIECDDETVTASQFNWDLNEEPVIAEGQGWKVQLVTHYRAPEESAGVPGSQLDWEAMKAEYERTGQPPKDLILKGN